MLDAAGLTMRAHDLVVGRWGARFLGQDLACAIGRSGISATKREGDGATPAGTHRFVGLLYRPDRIAPDALPRRAQPIGLRDLWCDDPGHGAYNHLVRAPFRHGHERLRRSDPLYDVVLITDWNWPDARRAAGSAIFVHCWRAPRRPTEGCVAFSRRDLLWILPRLRNDSKLVVRA